MDLIEKLNGYLKETGEKVVHSFNTKKGIVCVISEYSKEELVKMNGYCRYMLINENEAIDLTLDEYLEMKDEIL